MFVVMDSTSVDGRCRGRDSLLDWLIEQKSDRGHAATPDARLGRRCRLRCLATSTWRTRAA